jgi:TolA-binding protein
VKETIMKHPLLSLSLATFAGLWLAAIVSADTVFVGSLAYKDVKVQGVKGDDLIFLTSGNEAHKPVKDVTRLQLADEPALSAAEDAYAAKDWDKAVDGYERTLKSSNKDWLKDWSALRLLESANQGKRFDAAVTAFLAMLQRDPATAIKNKPTVPQGKSAFLDTAAAEVQRTLNETKLTDDQKTSLSAFLLEIQRARGDEKAIGAAVEQLSKFDADSTGDAASMKAVGDLKLGVANIALDKKDYKKAIDTIESNRPAFTDPKQQADALWIVAQSRYALATQSNDAAALKDAALSYMRIVTHFKDALNAPHVPESLLQTGDILEKLKDNDGALKIYQQLATQYPETAAGAKAKEAAERLKPKQG